ncbi:MAG TPA: VOC family protein [Terriglobales bacterium]|nr:VOC family protein [Terriglobales bacterium]
MSNDLAPLPQPPGRMRLHHVGYVVASIEESGESFVRSLGAKWNHNIVFDPLQNVRVTFLEGGTGADSLVELVEPGGPGSPVSRFLEGGGGFHHLCYEVERLEEHLGFCKSVGTIVIKSPVPAVAFGGRRIAWAVTKKRLLVEFLEGKVD